MCLRDSFEGFQMIGRILVSFSLLFLIMFSPLDAMAQSACPAGTVAGSQTCGEDAPPPRHRVERYEGYGAYANSLSGGLMYWVKGADAGGLAGVREEALDVCRRAGNSDCEIIGTWRNSCASVGRVIVDGAKQYILKTGSNGRASARAVRRECSVIAPESECKVNKAVCVDFRTYLIPY